MLFSHKREELRPLHPSTGSDVLSPRSLSDLSLISPFSLGSPLTMIPPTSTPLLTPGGLSPRGWPMWSNQSSPIMKGLSSRFRTTPSRQDLDLDHYRQQQLMDDFNKSLFMGDYIEERS
ncbi:zinc finger, CCCH-type, Ankyrin repeat-containing domain protein [Artemisia annua]|uniref:Zinc finger, CCCH-type, Ankyrin repeat-containing domain protein n=1 Tax=Artemisia annua TaxID=35608 RepID=A0A2U1KSD8_ARTAN|nr:zinc finger, CCCH-type, Ankyrin repeat-containing domain protein [Artemisia annua]